MFPTDLSSFLQLLEQADQLARVPVAVDPHLELATIVDQVSKGAGQGRALLFEQVKGSALPVATHLFGTLERVGWALGTTDLTGMAERFSRDLLAVGEPSAEKALRALTQAAAWQPIVAGQPIWNEVDHSAGGLDLLPAIAAWPGDGGPYLTLAQVYSRHPDGGPLNCGMYRIQLHERFTATIRCRPGSGAAGHLAAWHGRGLAMPVAVALGGPPALTWAATAPLPVGVEEAAFCGYLTGQRMTMSNCRNSGLQVPASAEVVIEGVIEPGVTRREGPFGNHTGSYDVDVAAPVLRVASVHARKGAICPWTLVGPPPRENIQLARATACLFLPLVRMSVPTVRELHMPDEGIFHRAALVTVAPGEERPLAEVASLLWGTALLNGSRLLVIGAADHDPHDPAAVFWRLLNRVDWGRDLLIERGRLAIDARRLSAGEAVRSDPAVLQKVLARWCEYRLDGSG
jgi:4-hydroxy-3-polyprenylbenzoate decarboxylase